MKKRAQNLMFRRKSTFRTTPFKWSWTASAVSVHIVVSFWT